ncbi:MAG: type II secretion system protein [Candidatus Wallbacteria bacterium]|nr:type II secretion system protein [Candidatus Wallbacteria bacterium]
MKNSKAFTLLELMAVLTIISVLIGISFVNSRIIIDHARDSKIKKQLNAVREAIEVYKTDHRGDLPKSLNELCPKYINRLQMGWEGSGSQGIIIYDPVEGIVKLGLESGKPADSYQKPYADY